MVPSLRQVFSKIRLNLVHADERYQLIFIMEKINIIYIHCVKSVRIRSYSGPSFPTFGQNMGRYSVSLRIHLECGKTWTRITSNADTFYAVILIQNCCISDITAMQLTSIQGSFNQPDLHSQMQSLLSKSRKRLLYQQKQNIEGEI